MTERNLEDGKGRIWTADEFAVERGYLLDEIQFAHWMQSEFGIRSYERMQQVWRLRDVSLRRNRSGTFPEGADITDGMG